MILIVSKIKLFPVISLRKKMFSISLHSFEKLEGKNLENLDLFVRENLNIGLDYKGGKCIVTMRNKKLLVGVEYAFDGELNSLPFYEKNFEVSKVSNNTYKISPK